MKMVIVLTILLLSTFSHAKPDQLEDNYCTDPASWIEWEGILKTNPSDEALRVLYALRIGLCAMVQRNELSKDASTKYFEQFRQQLIEQRSKQNQQAQEAKKLSL